MANLSQEKRIRMLGFLNRIKDEYKNEDDVLKAIYEIENELNSKKYGLVWEEHEENVDVQMLTHIPVFSEVKEKEIVVDRNDSNFNFLLEGDNLHSLKLLEKTHKGKIDVIYIDPPYNTGNKDFIYDDGYVDLIDGFRHSKWISFMSERLKISQKLIKSNGVIAISIGYQEVNNLILLCDEIFNNKQITCITVQTSGGKPNGGFNVSNEYIVFITPTDFKPIPSETSRNAYSSPYHGMTLASFNQVQRPNQAYPIFVNDKGCIVGYGKSLQEKVLEGSYTGDLADYEFDYNEAPEGTVAVFPVTAKGDPCVWRLISTRMFSDWKKGYIKVVPQKSKNNQNKYTIQYLSAGVIEKIESGEVESYRLNEDSPTIEVKEYRTAGADIPTIWTNKNFYTTKGSNQIKEVLGKKDFPYPKPIELILEILKRTATKDAIVLDFFAGSGTTGQAVLELNKTDNGNRRFILCTNNENSICESITYERLKNIILGYPFTGKKETSLYEKKITLKDLDKMDEVLLEIDQIIEMNKEKYVKINKTIKEGVLCVNGISELKNVMPGIAANLKYYKTNFIPKVSKDDEQSISDNLLNHIKEMVQLEHGISIDNENYYIILTDGDADRMESEWNIYKNCKAIYISQNVLLTASQNRLFNSLDIITIPDYYFESELREVGEIW